MPAPPLPFWSTWDSVARALLFRPCCCSHRMESGVIRTQKTNVKTITVFCRFCSKCSRQFATNHFWRQTTHYIQHMLNNAMPVFPLATANHGPECIMMESKFSAYAFYTFSLLNFSLCVISTIAFINFQCTFITPKHFGRVEAIRPIALVPIPALWKASDTNTEINTCLHQLVPVFNGFPWVCQHLSPVVPPRCVGIAAHSAHPNDFVVPDTAEMEIIRVLFPTEAEHQEEEEL